MHKNNETLSSVIKSARINSNFTVEQLAERTGITERYLYRIENEHKKPSFEVLYKLVRELNISPDLIFYPEKPHKDSEIEDIIRMLYKCNNKSMAVIRATIKAALDTQNE